MRTIFFLVALITASTSQAIKPTQPGMPSAAEAENQVLEFERQWVNAETKADVATLHRVLSDRFIGTFGTGKSYTKEPYIKAVVGDGPVDATASQTLSDQVAIVDGDTAVVSGTDTARGTDKGAVYTTVYRYTATYVWRDGHWYALALHIIAVPRTPKAG